MAIRILVFLYAHLIEHALLANPEFADPPSGRVGVDAPGIEFPADRFSLFVEVAEDVVGRRVVLSGSCAGVGR